MLYILFDLYFDKLMSYSDVYWLSCLYYDAFFHMIDLLIEIEC